MPQMNRKGIAVAKEELFYYLFIAITMGAKGIGLTGGQKIFTACMAAAYICLAVKLLLTEYTVREWILNLFLILLAFLIGRSSGETAALAAVGMIIGMKNVPLRRVMKAALLIWGSTFLFSVLRGIFLGDHGVVVVHSKLGLGPIIRYSLNYTHPNVLHVTYFIIMLLLLYVLSLRGRKLWLLSGLLFAGNLYIFLYSISYTGMIIVTFALALNLYFDARKRISKGERFLMNCFVPFCIIFPLAGPFLLKGAAFDFFNKLLSTRFELVYFYFTDFMVSLFGTRTVIQSGHLTLDSSFAYLLMYYGVIAFILMVGAYILCTHWCIRVDKRKETLILLAVALAGVTEQFLFNLSFKNITFFLIGDYLFRMLSVDGGTVWSRKIRILRIGREPQRIPVMAGLAAERRDGRRKQRSWLAAAFLAAALCGGLCAAYGSRYDQVYVNRGLCDYEGEYFIAEENQQWKEGSLFIGDMAPGEKIYEFRGNITGLERVRGIVSAAVWGGAAGAGIWVMLSRVSCGKKNTEE